MKSIRESKVVLSDPLQSALVTVCVEQSLTAASVWKHNTLYYHFFTNIYETGTES